MALRANDPRLGLTEREWNELEDPPGYRFEIIRGELDVTPGASPEHGSAIGELYVALRRKLPEGLRIVIDVDWHLNFAGRVTSAPRPDLMVVPADGPVVPILAVEVLSPSDHHKFQGTELTRIEAKRLDYAHAGLEHYLELDLASGTVFRYKLRADMVGGWSVRDAAEGHNALYAKEPFEYLLIPSDLI